MTAHSEDITKLNTANVHDFVDPTRSSYAEQCPTLTKEDHDKSFMLTAALGRRNQLPLVSYVVDTFNRYRIQQLLHGKDSSKDYTAADFTADVPYYQEKENFHVHSVLSTFQTRFVPKLQLEPLAVFTDSAEDILRYIYGTSQMIQTVLAREVAKENSGVNADDVSDVDQIIPFQFDLVIVPKGSKQSKQMQQFEHVDITDSEGDDDDDDDDDDDEEEDDEAKQADNIGDILPRLEEHAIAAEIFEIEQKTLDQNGMIYRTLNDHFRKVSKGRNARYVMVVDRRDDAKETGNDNDNGKDDEKQPAKKKNGADTLYMYSPKCKAKGASKVDEHFHELHKDLVEESLVFKTTKCLIPGVSDGIDPHLGCKNLNVITLSFHVLRIDLVKCYIYINGGGSRFEPSDLINILPKHFAKPPAKDSSLVDEQQLDKLFPLQLRDKNFDEWYKRTTAKTRMSRKSGNV
eukprot:CAMPEP_0197021786 /NCGR_PEP_ID=MMETSP1384-20130603/2703_1 /TAXON_ID=29189 /ORGANISM="Ammonia sp." /LENGTH=459 /DNA_ID=CAMNT_0042449693 /DNA_START=21 /DNA_END=1400 /DNA_ORIENTATION=+